MRNDAVSVDADRHQDLTGAMTCCKRQQAVFRLTPVPFHGHLLQLGVCKVMFCNMTKQLTSSFWSPFGALFECALSFTGFKSVFFMKLPLITSKRPCDTICFRFPVAVGLRNKSLGNIKAASSHSLVMSQCLGCAHNSS